MNLEKLFERLELSVVDKGSELIDICTQWWKGNVDNFHEYQDYQGVELGNVTRTRSSLGMAKIGTELWADSLWNPETLVLMGDEDKQEWLDDKFNELDFNGNMNNLIELTFAQGIGATVEYRDENNKAYINFVYADNILPLEYDNDTCISCAFISDWDNETKYVHVHRHQEDGTYLIENHFFQVGDNDELIEVEVEGIEKSFESEERLFQLYKPAIANNNIVGSPVGISINANALDELQAVDMAYHGLKTETKNGRMRVYLKASAIAIDVDGENKKPIVNQNQDEFYVLPGDDVNDDGTFIHVQAPTLRIQSFIDSLNTTLNLYGRKIGLGDNQFSNENGTIYTNTEQVISTNSKFYKTRMKHATIISQSVRQLVKALYYLEFNERLEDTISVQFDDSIIHDEQKENSFWERMLNAGHISKVQFWQETQGFTLEEAIEFERRQLEQLGLDDEIEMEE